MELASFSDSVRLGRGGLDQVKPRMYCGSCINRGGRLPGPSAGSSRILQNQVILYHTLTRAKLWEASWSPEATAPMHGQLRVPSRLD